MTSTRHPTLNPIVVATQIAMQLLFAGLLCFVVVLAILEPSQATAAIIVLACLMAASYLLVLLAHAAGSEATRRRLRTVGLVALVVLGLPLVWLAPQAAYLLFPLAFLYLDQMPPRWGAAAVAGGTALVVVVLGVHGGWTVGGIVGPLVAGGVAIVLGLSLRALRRQAAEQERLYRDLLAVQGRLAASERAAGVLAERARLAREIHDTVAQSLSSITLLLNAAERTDPDSPVREQVRLAREAASASLAETRRFISELAPPLLDGQSLGGALSRLAAGAWAADGLLIDVRVADALDLPMPVQAALLRVAQGAMSNVVTHAHATHATVEIVEEPGLVRLTVADDGVGTDAGAALETHPGAGRASFGLRAIRERAEELGGDMAFTSAPGAGATLAVWLPVAGR